MVKRLVIAALLLAGCGDSVVDHAYLGEPRMLWSLPFLANEKWVMAWLSPSLHFEGAQPLLPDERKGTEDNLVVWDAPEVAFRHEFPQLVPKAKLSFGVFLRLRGQEPLDVVNDVVRGGELLGVGVEPIIYVDEPGDSTLSPDVYYRIFNAECPPAREDFDAAQYWHLLPSTLGGDAGTPLNVPINAFLPESCRLP